MNFDEKEHNVIQKSRILGENIEHIFFQEVFVPLGIAEKI